MAKKGDMRRVCEVCDCPQFPSPNGWVCRNGHGGADWYPDMVEDYVEQYRKWFGNILVEMRRRHAEEEKELFEKGNMM